MQVAQNVNNLQLPAKVGSEGEIHIATNLLIECTVMLIVCGIPVPVLCKCDELILSWIHLTINFILTWMR